MNLNHYTFSIADVNFDVTSGLPINFARATLSPPNDSEPIKVTVLPISDVPEQGNFFAESAGKRFYSTSGGIAVELVDYTKKNTIIRAVSSPASVIVGIDDNYLLSSGMINGQMLLSSLDLPYLLLGHRRIVLHAASIEVAGKAIIFSAPSGTGKSTQAHLWETFRGANQKNGDKVALGIRDGICRAYAFPFAGTSGICLDYDLPLCAIVFLRQAKENSIVKLHGITALREFMNNAFGHESIPSYLSQMIDCASGILSLTPTYMLSCTPDENAVLTLENTLKESQ